jgi:hypothetical protein
LTKAWVESFKSMDNTIRIDHFRGTAYSGYSNFSSVDPVTKTQSYATSAYYILTNTRLSPTVLVVATANRTTFAEKVGNAFIAIGVSSGLNQDFQFPLLSFPRRKLYSRKGKI